MAGIHQLWWFDPVKRTAGVYAGTTVEALRDGPLPDVWMAQPSGLSASADGTVLWIADSETSALRYVERRRAAHRRRPGPVRLRARGRPGRAGAAAAPAGRVRAARRLGAGRRHLQRRGAPLRPGRPTWSPPWPTVWPSRATSCVTADRRRAGGRVGRPPPDRARARRAHRGRRGDRHRRAPPHRAPAVDAGTRRGHPRRHLHARRRARSWTTRSARRPGWRSRPRRRSCCSTAPGVTTDLCRTLVLNGNVRGRSAAGGRAGRHLRRRRRARRLPPDPAGLGRAGPGRRPMAPRPASRSILRGLDD